MRKFFNKYQKIISSIGVILLIVLLIIINLVLQNKKTSENKSYFASTGTNQKKIQETISFAKKEEKAEDIVNIDKRLYLPYRGEKIQYSGNIFDYKIIYKKGFEPEKKGVLDNFDEKENLTQTEFKEKSAWIMNLYFNDKYKKIYFPAEEVIFSGCQAQTSGDYILIDDLTNKLCQIAIFPKLNVKYKIVDKKGETKFTKDDVIIIIFKATSKSYYVKEYLKDYLTDQERIKSDYIYYFSPSLVNIPTKFQINGKIDNIKIYKIISKTNIDEKTAREFGIEIQTGIAIEKVLGSSLPWSLNGKYVQKVENFQINYFSGNTEVLLTPNEGDKKYLIYFEGKYKFPYFIEFEVKDKVGRDDYKFELYTGDLEFVVKSAFPFDKKLTERHIKQFFKPYQVNIDWWSNKSFRVIFYIPPEKLFSGNLIFENVVKTIIQPVKIYIDKIPLKYTYASIEGNLVNVLPKNGYWGNHISIEYKNLTGFDLYFQVCKLNPSINNKNVKIVDFDLAILECDGKLIHKKFVVKNFKYWKEDWIDFLLPEEIKFANYFKVSFYKDFHKGTKYFKRTNIGITTKKSKDRYYVFFNNLDDGSFIDSGIALFYSFENGEFKFKNAKHIKNGQVIFTGQGLGIIQVKKGSDETFSIVSDSDWYRGENIEFKIGDYISPWDINQSTYYGSDNTTKIYGYTDRGLYKAGDDVFFAGWVRDLKNKSHIPEGKVVVKLKHYGNEISKTEIENLDDFGGFKGKFTLSKGAELGVYQIEFTFGDNIRYSQDIKVEEYQKPVFFSKNKLINQNGEIFLKLNPQYYFGGNLKDYDLSIDWELKGKDICRYCRWRNDKDFYYNWVFNDSIYSGGELSLNNLKDEAVLKLIDLNKLKNVSYKITLKANINIKDNKTDETHFYTEYFDVNPPVMIGLDGQPVERLYKTDIKDGKYKINGHIQKSPVKAPIHYAIYKRNFGYNEERGVDGSYYYVNDTKFYTIQTGTIAYNQDFNLDVPIKGAGEYFVRFWIEKDGKILGEVQKRVYYYDYNSWYYSYMGDEKNNFVLTVQVPKKKYKLNEQIPININPYVKGSKVLITVERGNDILDVYKKTLDGGKITIPAKENYYPNANISVVEFVGEDNTVPGDGKKSPGTRDSRRPEPRFYIGYSEAELDDSMVKLIIDIQTDKKEYKPGEKIKLTISTMNAEGEPVETRLSIAIVDKALADLYDLIKKPIPYFYNKLGSFIANLSTWKNLYVALKVFSSGGEKGGGGGDAGSTNIRKKLYDLAFWRGGVFTKNGQITLETTAPDNLTTWMIDVVGITKNVKLGTARAYFKTTKDLIVQPNLPTFITVGDEIKLPVSVLTNKDLGNIDLVAYKGLKENGKIAWTEIAKKQVKGNEKTYFDLKLATDKFNYTKLYLKFVAKAKTEQDALQVEIPIRKKGFVLHKFAFTGAKQTNINFNFEDTVQKATYSLSLSKFPVEAFSKALKYLLHYPYGCTEQLSSGLYPILVANDLDKNEIELGEDIIKDGKINLGSYWEGDNYQKIKPIVEETIEKIFKNQKQDGGLGYWPDEQERSNVVLSAYVYGLLKNAQKQGFEVNKTKLAKLESYLDKIGNNPIPYLYYQWVKTSVGEKINVALFEDIYNKNFVDAKINNPELMKDLCKKGMKCTAPKLEKKLAAKVLAYSIYTNLGQLSKAQNIEINWDDEMGLQDRYWTFLNKDILKAIYLRAKLKQEGKITPEIQKIVLDLLEKRNSNGTWGRGTQKNVQILIALGEYMKKLNKNDKEFVCKVKINNVSKELKFKRKNNLNLEFENVKSLNGNISCNESLLIEQKVDYVLKDLNKMKTELHNLTGVNWTYTGGNSIGATVSWDGTFTTLKKADKLAVEFYIPSNYKFLKTIGKQNNTRWNKPFEVFGNDRCRWNITHYEVRFDRLFVYYNQLPANTSCGFRIKTIKAFEGKTNIMPVHIFEMYKTNVWGRKTVK